MPLKVDVSGDSEEAVALALLQLIGRAEGRIDGNGEPFGLDRQWVLDTYAECLEAVNGDREFGADNEKGKSRKG